MRNMLLIMRHEIYKTMHSAGYVIFAYIIPVLAVLILVGIQFFQQRSSKQDASVSNESSPSNVVAIEGYIDQSGLITQIPNDIQADRLLHFNNEELAQQALAAGEITAYYIIPPDIIERGKIDYVYPNTRSYLDKGQSWVMSRTLVFNLLQGDAELVDRVWNPVWEVTATSIAPDADQPSGEDCSRPGVSCASNDLIRYMPSIMVALFFASFMTSSSRLFNSVGDEKENRVIEVLLLSVSPRELLAGKTLGLGTAGLVQAITWLGAIYIFFNVGGSTLRLPENFVFPAGILIWGIMFFLGGFGLYASLMAGAGALVPKMKEAGAANYIAMAPLFIGYMFGLMAPLAESADTAFLTFLSIFPFTSPVVMIMRLTNSIVPFWQSALSLALLLVTAYYALRCVAAMFQAQNLLSGQPFSLKRYFVTMLGRI